MSDNDLNQAQNKPPVPAGMRPLPSVRLPQLNRAPAAAPVARPAARGALPEEPTVEPWEETEARLAAPPRPTLRPDIQRAEASPTPAPASRPGQAEVSSAPTLTSRPERAAPADKPAPAARFTPLPPVEIAGQVSRPPVAPDARVRPAEPRAAAVVPDARPKPAAAESRARPFPSEPRPSGGQKPLVLPRMELKPGLASDGFRVAAVKPRFTPQPGRPGAFQPPRPSAPAPVPVAAPEREPAAAVAAPAASQTAAPELGELLERMANLPSPTAILGVCDDSLPVLLNLADPGPGSLLAASDDEDLRTGLLRTLVQTAAALNMPRAVQFLALSARPESWRAWASGLDLERHCLAVESLAEGEPGIWLGKLVNWAEQRRAGSSGPAVLVVVDDMAAFAGLDYDSRVNFDWLIKEGPGVGIWPVGAMAVEDAPGLARWVRLFKTRILGPAVNTALYRQIGAAGEQESASLVDESQFAVRINENWLKFRLPLASAESV